MTDITQRLRSFVACEGGDLADVEQAADEIDRLRAALRLSLDDASGGVVMGDDVIAAARAALGK